MASGLRTSHAMSRGITLQVRWFRPLVRGRGRRQRAVPTCLRDCLPLADFFCSPLKRDFAFVD